MVAIVDGNGHQRSGLAQQQITLLRQPLPAALVHQRKAGGSRQVEYLESHEAINQANRLFGYGNWGLSVLEGPAWVPVGDAGEGFYSCVVRLQVDGCEPTTDGGTCDVLAPGNGRAITPDTHQTAWKGSISDAMKRAMRHFGDQFGNRLYDHDGPEAGEAAVANPALIDASELVALHRQIEALLAKDAEAGEIMVGRGQTVDGLGPLVARKTLAWLQGRGEAQRKGQTFWVDPGKQAPTAPTEPRDAAEVDSDVESHQAELARYVDAVAAHQEALRSTRGPMKPEAIATWRALYTRGQALVGPREGLDSRPASEVKSTELAAACGRLVQSALAELAREEVRA